MTRLPRPDPPPRRGPDQTARRTGPEGQKVPASVCPGHEFITTGLLTDRSLDSSGAVLYFPFHLSQPPVDRQGGAARLRIQGDLDFDGRTMDRTTARIGRLPRVV